jgi:hypothetical protein
MTLRLPICHVQQLEGPYIACMRRSLVCDSMAAVPGPRSLDLTERSAEPRGEKPQEITCRPGAMLARCSPVSGGISRFENSSHIVIFVSRLWGRSSLGRRPPFTQRQKGAM